MKITRGKIQENEKDCCIRAGRDREVYLCFPIPGSGFYRHRREYIIHGTWQGCRVRPAEHAPRGDRLHQKPSRRVPDPGHRHDRLGRQLCVGHICSVHNKKGMRILDTETVMYTQKKSLDGFSTA